MLGSVTLQLFGVVASAVAEDTNLQLPDVAPIADTLLPFEYVTFI